MRIETLDPRQADLESLRGVAVVLDIFRAGNTIASLLDAGAPEVWLVSTLEEARKLKAEHPEIPLLGERHGIAPDDFDGGNSPVHAPETLKAGLPVILTTSAGTRAVHRLTNARAVFYGTFAGASALTGAIRQINPQSVHFLPMGLEAKEPCAEDDAAAAYLADMLQGGEPEFAEVVRGLGDCDGADRLTRLNQLDDLAFCLTVDCLHVVPVVRYGQGPPKAVAWKP